MHIYELKKNVLFHSLQNIKISDQNNESDIDVKK